jgi:acetolactate synthase-1/2/3 large subunit
MGIGASLSGAATKTIALIGDGGAQLMLGELATAVEADAPLVFVLMNDRGYGIIRNIQDAHYCRRRAYADLLTPDFSLICASIGMHHELVSHTDNFDDALARCLDTRGPAMVEVDMDACGPFARAFVGSPAKPAVA